MDTHPSESADTHEVFNQTPPFGGIDLVASDRPLLDGLQAQGIDVFAIGLSALGQAYGAVERLELGRLANENPPKLRTHDARGHRVDRVESTPPTTRSCAPASKPVCIARPGTNPAMQAPRKGATLPGRRGFT